MLLLAGPSLGKHAAVSKATYVLQLAVLSACCCSQDPHLVSMLQMYKRSGRKLFLATNSLWDYTNVVMNYLCG
jgi:hypothetical protein